MLPESEGQRFFTINLHLASKSGSPSVQGDARPPPNLGVAQRTSQVEVVAVSLFLSKKTEGYRKLIVSGRNSSNQFSLRIKALALSPVATATSSS